MGRGAQPSASLLLFSLGLVFLYFTAGSTVRLVEAQASEPDPVRSMAMKYEMKQKTWCIAKPSASNEILAQNLNYACSQVSCAVIQKGGPCYYPDSLVSRAAVAMNLYYAFSGRHAWNCYFNNSALVVQSDPSTSPANDADPVSEMFNP
ncbi:hypothetical protein HU200_027624 [Digitaria exilis]|uniref:X8 domain-containing protein n=1 Tax=Digitaria exilis TaxID=1010633 RepID=A0A835BWC8_9POAL|nr:hypothetical protein HU200_027624 [Digitaria exilis]